MASDRDNIRIKGPTVVLDSHGALALALAIHELTTNAAKYGALSVPEGDVSITWDVECLDDEEHLVLDWTEQSGPPVTPPVGRGFGSTLIKRALEYDLRGHVEIMSLQNGVRASVRAPLRTRADKRAVGAVAQG